MDVLHDELLLKILQYVNIKNIAELDNIRCISSRFYRLCRDFTILNNIIKGLIESNRKKEGRVFFCRSVTKDLMGMIELNHATQCTKCDCFCACFGPNYKRCACRNNYYCCGCHLEAPICHICSNPHYYCDECMSVCKFCKLRTCKRCMVVCEDCKLRFCKHCYKKRTCRNNYWCIQCHKGSSVCQICTNPHYYCDECMFTCKNCKLRACEHCYKGYSICQNCKESRWYCESCQIVCRKCKPKSCEYCDDKHNCS